MLTKRKSANSSKASSVPTKRAGRSKVASDIISGLREAVAFSRGEVSLPVRVVNVLDPIDVRAIRLKLGLSQAQFATQYGISLRTLQEWEQGRTSPDGAVRAYLTVIERDHKAVLEALAG
jgi:putative transcriptional regulator